ncbi:hypothetical protein PENTCL1PPCAC_581, partial [Pristionchus entomophagus]
IEKIVFICIQSFISLTSSMLISLTSSVPVSHSSGRILVGLVDLHHEHLPVRIHHLSGADRTNRAQFDVHAVCVRLAGDADGLRSGRREGRSHSCSRHGGCSRLRLLLVLLSRHRGATGSCGRAQLLLISRARRRLLRRSCSCRGGRTGRASRVASGRRRDCRQVVQRARCSTRSRRGCSRLLLLLLLV